MTAHTQLVSPQTIKELASAIDDNGFACLTDYVEPQKLSNMRSFVSDAIAKSHGRYASFRGAEEMAGSSLNDMAHSTPFEDLMRGIYEAGTGRLAPNTDFHQILRCLSGEDMTTHSLRFHYDSYVLTALIPIEIPANGRRGDLLIIPNARNIRNSYAANLMDKVLLDNSLSQKWFKRKAARSVSDIVRLSLVPGNLYFFWGYRSIHTNEACDPDRVRATALFHYADPHEGSMMKRLMKRAYPQIMGAHRPHPCERPAWLVSGSKTSPTRADIIATATRPKPSLTSTA